MTPEQEIRLQIALAGISAKLVVEQIVILVDEVGPIVMGR